MARIVKTRRKPRRKINLLGFSLILFVLSSLLYLGSSLFLRTYNNNLSAQKQELETEIAAIEIQNDAVRVDIQNLSTRNRVDEIAASSGLSNQQNNIITISNTDTTVENGE